MKFYYKFMILFVGVGIILLLLSINCSKRSANIVLPNLIIETTSPMEYTAPYGGPSPLSVFVKVKSSTDDEIPYSFRTDAVWMTLANSQHMDTTITPDSFIVLFDVAKPGKFLDVGTYIDSITFKSENAENSPQYLEFIMNIGSEMIISPPGLSYVAALDGDNPPPQRFYISNSFGENFSYTIEKSATWLNLSNSAGTAPDSILANINTTGLAQGMYIDTVFVLSDDVLNSGQNVVCSLSVSPWYAQYPNSMVDLQDVFFVDRFRGWAVGVLAGDLTRSAILFRTTDGGLNWSDSLVFTSPEDSSLLGTIRFIDETGWIVGDPGIILYTTDGGDSWNSQSTGLADTTISLNDLFFISVDTGWIVGDSGLILKTTDGGINWMQKTSNTFQHLFGVTFIDGANGWVVGNFNVILHTSDGGETWNKQTSGDFDYRDVYFVDLNNGWMVGKLGTIMNTTDGGINWLAQPTPVTSNLSSIFFINDSTGWATGENGVILYTSTGGSIWTQQLSDTDQWLFSIYFIDELTGWVVGENGTIRFTSSGGN